MSAMRFKVLLIYSAICWATMGTGQVGLSSDELKLFNLVNQERKKAGLAPLEWNYHLAEAARAHTQAMAQHRVLTHRFKDEPVLGERVGATGLRFNGAAENVAEGDAKADTVARLHASLMDSPPHRANILSSKYGALGLAIISSGGDAYVTEDFAQVLPNYSETQFRSAVITAFNKMRQAHRLPAMAVGEDSRVYTLACSESNKPQIPDGFANALNVVAFTASDPAELPVDMQKAATDNGLRRMNLAACFRPDSEHGYGNFWVVATFYP